jgi:hypothetical protein
LYYPPSSHGARYYEREDGAAAKGERRVQLVGARVLQAVRHGICSVIGCVASKHDREQSTFEELNS